MVLTLTPIQSQFFILSSQLSDHLTLELNHQAYRQSHWYGKVISFFLNGPSILEDLSLTEKRAVEQASAKYRVTHQHLLFIEKDGETDKCPLLNKITAIFKWAHDEHGHFPNQLTLHKVWGQ